MLAQFWVVGHGQHPCRRVLCVYLGPRLGVVHEPPAGDELEGEMEALLVDLELALENGQPAVVLLLLAL